VNWRAERRESGINMSAVLVQTRHVYKCDETNSNGSHGGDEPSRIYGSFYCFASGNILGLEGVISCG